MTDNLGAVKTGEELAAEAKTVQTIVGVLDKKMNRTLKQYMDICARCAVCKDACHQYTATGDLKYLPARRAELIRQIYRKYFTKAGQFSPALYEARDPDENLLDELADATYACTGCRRCMYYCPFSIDTGWILAAAKAILIAAGRGKRLGPHTQEVPKCMVPVGPRPILG